MSFALVLSNFQGVSTLLLNLYNSYTNAPEQFRNLSQEILSLHVVYKQIETQLYNQELGNNTLTLSAKEADDLKVLHDGLQTIMKELDDLLKQYQSLTESRSISIDRIRWGQVDLAGLRQRILIHACLLTAFNTSLLWYVRLLRFLFRIIVIYFLHGFGV